MSWTEAHDNYLRGCFSNGMSCDAAATAINALFKTSYSRSAVIGRAHRKKIEPALARSGSQKVKVRKSSGRIPVVARQPPEPVVERVADVVPRHITIYELTDGTCRWPFGDAAPHTFCGCQVVGDGPYCAPHDAIARRSS